MSKHSKVYKPSEEEILKSVIASFAIENIIVSLPEARIAMSEVREKIKKESE